MTKRPIYVVLLGISLFPFLIKKELKELKIAAIILFTGVFGFIAIIIYQLIFKGNFPNNDETYVPYY